MNVRSVTNDAPQEQLDAALDRLTEQVRARIPGVQCRIHHGANDHFAWWVTARLSNRADESKIVDVSIECRSAQPQLAIHADLAREDGTVLHEFARKQLEGEPTAGTDRVPLHEALRGIESFLLGQVECLVAELS